MSNVSEKRRGKTAKKWLKNFFFAEALVLSLSLSAGFVSAASNKEYVSNESADYGENRIDDVQWNRKESGGKINDTDYNLSSERNRYRAIKNGDFSDGQTGWMPYIDENAGAEVSYKDGRAEFAITNTGTESWHIQLYQDYIKLEKGKKYRISLRVKSSINRKLEFVCQHNGYLNDNWESYMDGFAVVNLTNNYQTFSREFTMSAETDEAARLSIFLGAIYETVITDYHTISIDDVILEEIKDESKREDYTGKIVAAGSGQSKASYRIISDSGKTATASYQMPENFSETSVIVPENVEYKGKKYEVIEIAEEAFKGNKNITKVVVGANVSKVGKNAFKNAEKLKTVDLSKSKVKTIGNSAFYGAKGLKNVKINANHLKTVGKKAFQKIKNTCKFTIYAKNKKVYEKIKNEIQKAGAKKSKFKGWRYFF